MRYEVTNEMVRSILEAAMCKITTSSTLGPRSARCHNIYCVIYMCLLVHCTYVWVRRWD